METWAAITLAEMKVDIAHREGNQRSVGMARVTKQRKEEKGNEFYGHGVRWKKGGERERGKGAFMEQEHLQCIQDMMAKY